MMRVIAKPTGEEHPKKKNNREEQKGSVEGQKND